MIAAPISETYGRSVVYKVSSLAFMFFVLGAGFSKSFASLLVCRFFAGTLGGPVLAVGAGTNADMYAPKDRAIASSLFVMMPVSNSTSRREPPFPNFLTVPRTCSGPCHRRIRRSVQRLALDPMVHHLHCLGRCNPSYVHVGDLQEDHPGPTSKAPQHPTASANSSERHSHGQNASNSHLAAAAAYAGHRADRLSVQLVHGFHILGALCFLRCVPVYLHHGVRLQYMAVWPDVHCDRSWCASGRRHEHRRRPTILCQTPPACAQGGPDCRPTRVQASVRSDGMLRRTNRVSFPIPHYDYPQVTAH
jgi:hypothetical protein